MKKFLKSKNVREFFRILVALAIGLSLAFILTLFVSEEPIVAIKALMFGPISQLNRIGDWIEESISLIFLGLAVTIVFSAKQYYVGFEGQMLIAALASGTVAIYLPVDPIIRIPAAFLAGIIMAILWSAIPAILKASLNANILISSIMMNTIGLRLFDYILRTYLQMPKANGVMSERVPEEARLSTFIPNLPFLTDIRTLWMRQTNVSWMLYIMIIAIVLAYLLLYKTKFGYEIRAVGANPKFAKFGGIDVNKTIVASIMVSGIFTGLAGAHLTMGIMERVILSMGLGLGFEGVNVAVLASVNPLGVPIAGLFYGYLRAGADIMERSSDVSRELVFVLQACVLLLLTAEKLLPTIQQVVTTENGEDETPELTKGSEK